jgi:hypothetical protein
MSKYIVTRTGSFGISLGELKNYLDQGYKILSSNYFGNGVEYVLEKETSSSNTSEDLHKQLVKSYIEDTKDSDGTLFCGCNKEDCDLYGNYSECEKCLYKHLKELYLKE